MSVWGYEFVKNCSRQHYVSHNHGILNMAIKINVFTCKRSPHLVVVNDLAVVRKLTVVFREGMFFIGGQGVGRVFRGEGH